MIVYNKLGYKIKALSKDDGKEIFQFIIQYKKDEGSLDKRVKNRELVKKLIVDELEIDNHTALGIYTGSELVGVCFTELYSQKKDVMKMSYIKIKDEEKKKIAPHVLFNFLINILYEDIQITFKEGMLNRFKEIVKDYPKTLRLSGFRDDYSRRIKKYFEEH